MDEPNQTERKTRTSYRLIGKKPEEGELSCGFMYKPSERDSNINLSSPFYSCVVLLDGTGEYWDETGVYARLGPGSVVQRLPNRIHSTKVDGDGKWLEFFVGFGPCVYDMMAKLDLLNHDVPVGYYPEVEKEIPRFQKLLSWMTESTNGQLLGPLQMAQQVAVTLTSCMNTSVQMSLITSQACEILGKDLKKELLLTDVAKKLSIGYETFRKQFQREVQMSPDAFRHQKRMITAQLLLLEGRPVKYVAKELGYSDTYAFSKQFKHYSGCSPALYVNRIAASAKKREICSNISAVG